MGQRQTRLAGIQKVRLADQNLQRTLDAVIERLEVLDGLRGDALDQAITYRDLGVSGFDISVPFSGGVPSVTPPTSPDGPGIGPALAPSNLLANETFLAILLTWDNPSFNLQHIEVWRATTDNLSLANLIGTTVAPLFVDYVGGSASYYYWVRAIGTDGTPSAYNDTAGTLGTTGVDPSDFEVNINVSTSNLDAALAARIDLIDDPTTGLVDRLAVAEGEIVSIDSRTDVLEASLVATDLNVSGLDTQVTANAASISTQSSSITVLQSDVAGNSADAAANAAAITANASDILNLEASIGAIDAGGGQTWEFDSTVEGFTAANATVTQSGGALVFTPNASNPQLTSPIISISGGIHSQVIVRVRQTIGGGTWEGRVAYQTSAHIISGSYEKTIADPSLSLSEWTTLTWDMSDLTTGGDDWVNSTIEAIRLDLVSDAGGKFEIDYILIAKFSTAALSEAISGLDVRVTANEAGISSNTTSLVNLTSTVDDATTGVAANSTAISSLQTNVSANDIDIVANSAAIVALQTTVNDGTTGVAANASAISVLETSVSTNDGLLTSQAQSITQLVASVDGAFASMINPLRTLGDGFGSSYADADVQTFSLLDRAGAGGKRTTAFNVTDTLYGRDGSRVKIEPRGIYELRFSIFHDRGLNEATWDVAMTAYDAASGGSNQLVYFVNNGVVTGSSGSGTFLEARQDVGNEWADVACYILGSDVDPATCPDLTVNGSATYDARFNIFRDGLQTSTPAGSWVEFYFSNRNTGIYGDAASTSLWVTDVSLRRVDTLGTQHAAIKTEATVRASETGDLSALYTVKAELSIAGEPYVTGFGLSADVIAGNPTSAFGIRADQFFVTSPDYGTAPSDPANSSFPFIIDLVDGAATVAIDGQLIVDGTIRAESIVANSIGANQIAAIQLSAISADIGTITAGVFRTAANPAFRVEMEDQASTAFPLWYGSGPKASTGGRFYVDANGSVVIKGLLDAGMIRQSFFAPAGGNNSFRVACAYPGSYSNGIYTGPAAHLNPSITTGYSAAEGTNGTECYDRTNYNTALNLSQHRTGWQSDWLTLLSPTNSSSTEYGRLGSLSENLLLRYSAECHHGFGPPYHFWLIVQYQYDSETIRQAYIQHLTLQTSMRTGHLTAEDIFVSRSTAWSTLRLRLAVGCRRSDESAGSVVRGTVANANLTIETANFGYADQSIDSQVTGSTIGSTSINLRNSAIVKQYL